MRLEIKRTYNCTKQFATLLDWKKKYKSSIQLAEISFHRSVKSCSARGVLINENIWLELEIFYLNYKIEGRREISRRHLNRMDHDRIPVVVNYYNLQEDDGERGGLNKV